MRNKRFFFFLLLLLVGSFLGPINQVYADPGTIFQHHKTVISDPHSTVENVVVIGGDAYIHGTVRDVVIVINGDLHISKTARIPGFIFLLGGHLYQETGAQITDDVITISLDDATSKGLVIGGILLFGLWVVHFAFCLFTLLFVALFSKLFKNYFEPFVRMIRIYPVRLLAIGLTINVLFIAIGILLSLTVIGIPLMFGILILLGIKFLIGFTVISYYVGEYIPGMYGKPEWLQSLSGAVFLLSLIHFPFIGTLVLMVLFWISLGMFVWWFWERRKRTK